jgi:hypothetical protein
MTGLMQLVSDDAMNSQRLFVTKDVAPESVLGRLQRRHTLSLTPPVGGRRRTSLEPGGERMEPDRYWLLLLMGAQVLLAFVIILQRIW